jgi:hypothetical protein
MNGRTEVHAVQYERLTALLGDGRKRRRLGYGAGELVGEEFV